MCNKADGSRAAAPQHSALGFALENQPSAATSPQPQGRRFLIRQGILMTMDAELGDFPCADVLIDDGRVVAVGVDLPVADAEVIDARGRIVMPGFIDTHHHMFETALRGWLSNALLFNDGTPEARDNYLDLVVAGIANHYRPEDVYLSDLIGSLSQLDAGVTTVLDLSQIHHSPEHTDAAITAFAESGQRCVLAYYGTNGGAAGQTAELERLRKQHFATRDQLLTLACVGEIYLPDHREMWEIARHLDLPIVSHIVGALGLADIFAGLARDGLFGSDNLFLHMTGIGDQAWTAVQRSGAGVSLAVPIELMMRHGTPPILKLMSLGGTPSLSTDVECTMSADFFTQMRTLLAFQRGLVNEAVSGGADAGAPLLSSRDVIRFATVRGAEHLWLAGRTGTISVGKEADIILLNAAALNVAPVNNVPGTVATLMDRSNVETVIVGGRIRKWRGALCGIDIGSLARQIETRTDILFSRAGIKRIPFG